MGYKCCVVDCRSSYAGEERTTVFSSPKEKSLRKIWIKFVNRKDWEPTLSSFICVKYFDEKYYSKGKNDKRYHLTKTLKPVPTIFNPNIQTSQCSSSSHIYPQWQCQGDHLENVFIKMTNTKVLWITIWLTNLVTSKIVFPLLVFYSRIMTMSPSAKLNLVKNAHLKLQNALKLTRNYM